MSSVETSSNNNEWTLGTLLAHLSAIIAANDRRYEERFVSSQLAVDAALNAAKEAVLKAEAASEKRFESVNEFRGQLADQQAAETARANELKQAMMPRRETELQFDELRNQIAEMNKQITALFTINAARSGQETGRSALWGYIVGAVGLLLAIVTFILTRLGR